MRDRVVALAGRRQKNIGLLGGFLGRLSPRRRTGTCRCPCGRDHRRIATRPGTNVPCRDDVGRPSVPAPTTLEFCLRAAVPLVHMNTDWAGTTRVGWIHEDDPGPGFSGPFGE